MQEASTWEIDWSQIPEAENLSDSEKAMLELLIEEEMLYKDGMNLRGEPVAIPKRKSWFKQSVQDKNFITR